MTSRTDLTSPPPALVTAARALVAKLDECREPIASAFVFSAAHGIRYDGPNYADELEALRAALSEAPRADATGDLVVWVMQNGHAQIIGATWDEQYARANSNYVVGVKVGQPPAAERTADEPTPRTPQELVARLINAVCDHGSNVLLHAPCIFCAYNGAGYYQAGTHPETCPWHRVGGMADRLDMLPFALAAALSAPRADAPGDLVQLVREWQAASRGYCRGEIARKIDADAALLAWQPPAASGPPGSVTDWRCGGCDHRWPERYGRGATLCGDCWRKVQPVLHASGPPAAPPAPVRFIKPAPERVGYCLGTVSSPHRQVEWQGCYTSCVYCHQQLRYDTPENVARITGKQPPPWFPVAAPSAPPQEGT